MRFSIPHKMGMHPLRIGDYRVIYARTREGVIVLRIGHRGKIL
ncbi:MAG: type II toxin-antitoxin system RelE/ParE family toxin [Thermoplasmata archaeon]|nr:type II toxin-antitoxin system RelE/ParE family toxin [Thermoplasmata archaeon]